MPHPPRERRGFGRDGRYGPRGARAAGVPVLFDGASVVAAPLEVGGVRYAVTCVSMGNPHCVVFGDDPDTLDLERIGPGFEHFERFPARINTEFIQVLDSRTLKMRVWERGSGETMACGTGACAAVVAACLNGYCRKGEDVRVLLRGGELTVRYTDEGVQMTGGGHGVYRHGGDLRIPRRIGVLPAARRGILQKRLG